MAATQIPNSAIGTYVPRSKIEAAQLTPDDLDEISAWLKKNGLKPGNMFSDGRKVRLQISDGEPFSGPTAEGGDWIALIDGKAVVFSDAQFTSMYELG